MAGGSCWRLLAASSLVLVASALMSGQDVRADRLPPARYPVSAGPVVPPQVISPQIIRAAGIIFSGRVTSVGRAAPGFGNNTASTMITFQVERAIRGTSAGRTLSIHEWSGLWARGERYRVGEHVLLFLYPPSKLGLTSPVAGAAGKFALDPRGEIVMKTQNSGLFAADTEIGGRAVVPYADFAETVRRGEAEK